MECLTVFFLKVLNNKGNNETGHYKAAQQEVEGNSDQPSVKESIPPKELVE